MTENKLQQQLAENLEAVEARIEAACTKAGRQRNEVSLVAVTKYVSIATAAALHELGVYDLGESRPQELWKKAAALPTTVRWHLIGHLQRNKIARSLPLVSLNHSVDSIRLLDAIEQEAEKQTGEVDVLVEVNLSNEANKTGLPPGQLRELQDRAKNLKHTHVKGLMTMAAFQDAEACRPTFAQLRQLAPYGAWLSMGMSNDFEVAIEEGATHVRLGSVLFEGIPDERPGQ